MSILEKARVRFAPAPTGMMHLGNIRTALMNYLLSHQKNGTFVLRIEDTDLERNFDPGAEKIKEDLAWLGLTYDEGPGKERPEMAPYFQSQRDFIYQRELQSFIKKGLVYRCFCSTEELEKKRQRQIALKQPPRYDGVCRKLTIQESDQKSTNNLFIWRMKVDHEQTITIHDLAHGPVHFDLKNFSDFPISRQNGSVTFMFANFIDDVLMNIDCIIRGEDHLSNTAGQAAMYLAYGAKIPLYWHMPILCSTDGKKLSKRDFGFSLRDLKESGFLPEAIINYLGIIGKSFANEIMDKQELIQTINFDNVSTTGQIKYDVEKLRWVNHKWIARLSLNDLTNRCLPFLHEAYPTTKMMEYSHIETALGHIQQEMITLRDSVTLLAFYFDKPSYDRDIAQTLIAPKNLASLCSLVAKSIQESTLEAFLALAKKEATATGISPKELFSFLRYGLTGSPTGLGIAQLGQLLDYSTLQRRLTEFLQLFG